MKVTLGVFLGFACLATIYGLPTSKTTSTPEADEIEFVPLERHNPFGDQPIVDTGVISSYDSPFSNPFGGLFENLEGMMTRIRKQMETLLKRFPVSRGNSSEEIPSFPGPVNLPPFGLDEIDLGKGNTTSITKVIDGHKVVINETEYKKEDDFGGAFFKVRIIDVRPDSSELTTNKDAEEVTTVSTIKDRESVESSIENEIFKSKEGTSVENIETFDDVDNNKRFEKISTPIRHPDWTQVSPIETFQDNSLNAVETVPSSIHPVDLSGDIRVNNIMADAGAPMDPDAEFIYDIREPHVKQFEKFVVPR